MLFKVKDLMISLSSPNREAPPLGCGECSGCSDCTGCSECSGCSDCTRCSDCTHCSDCTNNTAEPDREAVLTVSPSVAAQQLLTLKAQLQQALAQVAV